MSQITHLALYHYMSCSFCAITRREVAIAAAAALDIEQRDIQLNPEHRRALIQGGGKAQVPCLRIERADGRVSWLYESAEIIAYLRNQSAAA